MQPKLSRVDSPPGISGYGKWLCDPDCRTFWNAIWHCPLSGLLHQMEESVKHINYKYFLLYVAHLPSFCCRYVFPSVLVIYQTIDLLIFSKCNNAEVVLALPIVCYTKPNACEYIPCLYTCRIFKNWCITLHLRASGCYKILHSFTP